MKSKKTLSQTIFSNRENGEDMGCYLIITVDRKGNFKDYGTAFHFRDIKNDETYRKSRHGKATRKKYFQNYFQTPNGKQKMKRYHESEKGKNVIEEYNQRSDVKSAKLNAIKKYQKTEKGKATKKRADKKYRQTENGKKSRAKMHAKRRGLGHKYLNSTTEGIDCVGHHINEEEIIFIPEFIHCRIKHNLKTGKNMKLINSIAEGFK